MIPLVSPKFNYIYYYNPKSACSTHRTIFLELHRDVISEGQEMRLKDVNARFRPTGVLDSKVTSGFYKYTVVRNPYSRLVSAYLDKCFEFKYAAHKRYKNEQLVKTIQEPISQFLRRGVDLETGYSFHEFIDYLKLRKTRSYRGVNMHFHPQLFRDGNVKLNAAYRIEDDIEQMKKIYREIFIDHPIKKQQAEELCDEYALKKVNPTVALADERSVYDGFVGNANFTLLNKLKDAGSKFDYGSFYNEEILLKVSEIAREELDLYEYSFPYSH